MKIVTENLVGIRYKLMMMGVPISGPLYIYGDNMFVIYNNQQPEYTLKKKSNYIWYHAICESIAMVESLTGHVGTNENCSDLVTNALYGGKSRLYVQNFPYNIYDDLWAFAWQSYTDIGLIIIPNVSWGFMLVKLEGTKKMWSYLGSFP